MNSVAEPHFIWQLTPSTFILLGNLVTMIMGGRIWFARQTNQGLKIDNADKLQDLATKAADRADQRTIVLEEKLTKKNDALGEIKNDYIDLREYVLRDAVWHVQVLAEIKRLGGDDGSIPPAPTLPPRQRTQNEDHQVD